MTRNQKDNIKIVVVTIGVIAFAFTPIVLENNVPGHRAIAASRAMERLLMQKGISPSSMSCSTMTDGNLIRCTAKYYDKDGSQFIAADCSVNVFNGAECKEVDGSQEDEQEDEQIPWTLSRNLAAGN